MSWMDIAKKELDEALARQPITNVAKNVIFFVGDGLGLSTTTAARIYKGQLQGVSGEEQKLLYETFPSVALSKVQYPE